MTRGGLDHLRSTVKTHVQREGLRPLSARTGIPVGQLRSLLDGRAALSTTIECASTAFGLEFYVGPPRGSDPGGAAADRAAGTPVEAPAAATPPAWVMKLRNDLREDVATLLREFTVAEHRALLATGAAVRQPALSGAAPSADSVRVRMLDAAAGGDGGGVPPLEQARVTGYQEFPRRWLERHEIDAGRCAIVGIRGDAMEPTLPDGCSVLVDYTRRRLRVGRIFVVRSGAELLVRRALKDRAGRWLLAGDHHRSTPPVPWDRRTSEVVGEVRWMATTFSR
ncbi:MAG: S24/S26 family peptidase [Gammaproteobacteria bacterium]|nr:S24/S26 family peptidase [Gammaproteobacteria bacterium]